MSLPALRRFSRKRSMPSAFGSAVTSPHPSAKKSRKLPVSSPSTATLLTLPHCAISRLLLCLDVDSIENLSASCSYFDELISSKFLTSINFPLTLSFIKEVDATNCVEKKSLLKLSSRKSRADFKIFPNMPGQYSKPSSQHKLIVDMNNNPAVMDYLILSQMSLLSLHKVREVDLVPDIFREDGYELFNPRVRNSYMRLKCSLLKHISR